MSLDHWPFKRKDKRDEHLRRVHGAPFRVQVAFDESLVQVSADAHDPNPTVEVAVGGPSPASHEADIDALAPAVPLDDLGGEFTPCADATALLSKADTECTCIDVAFDCTTELSQICRLPALSNTEHTSPGQYTALDTHMASQFLLSRPSTPFDRFYPCLDA